MSLTIPGISKDGGIAKTHALILKLFIEALFFNSVHIRRNPVFTDRIIEIL